MQRIVLFIVRNKHFFLFLFLLSIALFFTAQSHSYHRSKFINSANWFTGSLYETSAGVKQYFSLRSRNEELSQENERLRQLLYRVDKVSGDTLLRIDTTLTREQYVFRKGRIIKNSFASSTNFLTIDKGESDGIGQDMGVVSSLGIVGVVAETSAGYATVISILHTEMKINAKLKNSNHFGTLYWSGSDPTKMQLQDIPKPARLSVGDTVVTGGASTIFPEGMGIGTITNFSREPSENYYTIEVSLFNDMTNLYHVYVIENKDSEEILELQNQVENP